MFTEIEVTTAVSDLGMHADEYADAVEDALLMQEDYPARPGESCQQFISRIMGG